MAVLIVLLVLWLVLSVVGFALKGLLWLGSIGLVLLLGTTAIGLAQAGITKPLTRVRDHPPREDECGRKMA